MTPAGRLRTRLAAATDVGRRRSGNEDSHALWESSGAGPADVLVVVCDGMGGSNAGEVASRMTVDAVVRHFERDGDPDPGTALAHALEAANTEVWEHTRSRPDLQGMGTTCTALAVRGDECVLAHVGDSRAYLVRGGRIRQVTQDHSLVAQLVASGQLTPDAAKVDPRRNVVTRSVGISPSIEVDLVRLDEPLRAGDTLLLCSDGLHGQVGESDLARLASGESLERASLQMIDLANQRGGPDNITVALARVEELESAARGPARPARNAPAAPPRGAARRRTLLLLIVALVALTIAVSGLAWMVMRADRVPAADTGTPAGERDR